MPVTPSSWLQCALLILLILGALAGQELPMQAASVLAVIWMASQWSKLIGLARLFMAMAVLIAVLVLVLDPAAAPRLGGAVVQGTGFAALMMVLGLLRQPVKRAATTRRAAEALLAAPPGRRFGVVLTGAQFMALMFNLGIIAMIGDLTQPADGRDMRSDPTRRSVILASMRGAALTTIWSPMSLGFAIVTTNLPALEPLRLIAVAFLFTVAIMALASRWPLLPEGARPHPVASDAPVPKGGRAVLAVLAVSAVLLGLTIAAHRLLGLGFTLASVTVLPAVALIWLAIEGKAEGPDFGARLGEAVSGLADLRSEATLFLAANVIGAGLAIAIEASPLWPVLNSGGFATLPVLLATLVLIPGTAASYLPNTIMVVLAAQVFGGTKLGLTHPLSLALTLCIGWSMAICVNPISAMNLVSGRFCGVSGSTVALRWNVPFALMMLIAAAGLISAVYACGG